MFHLKHRTKTIFWTIADTLLHQTRVFIRIFFSLVIFNNTSCLQKLYNDNFIVNFERVTRKHQLNSEPISNEIIELIYIC